ncbi:MAG: hypothetical protein NTX87_11535 [Planctomycetota bacterium]|nr:hypothetical protein [Planctomycetota bacterium]
MKRTLLVTALLGALGYPAAMAADAPPPIEKVEIGANRALLVNGRPFFPLMAWLQDAANFPAVKACGMNTTAGYWSKSSGTEHVGQYLDLVEKAGLYGVMPSDPHLKGRPALLAYIHDDEPDLPGEASDAQVEPGPGLRVNRSTPLWRLLDGVTHSWSVLDPLKDASVTLRLKAPVTVESLAVHLTISKGLSAAKEVVFTADGKEILKAALDPSKKGQQKFALPAPVTLKELTMKVTAVAPGDQEWGSLGEIEGFDNQGRNVLLSPPRTVPRAAPAVTLEAYRAMKAADPSRPIFLTLTGHFHPFFKKYTDEQRQMYAEYVKAADVVGYDIYPIYGWNKPEWIYLVHDATDLLARLAAPRPVYAWIETSKGGQWTGPLEGQKDVTPAHIRAEVWMALCRGATAIGYFTHVWKPAYSPFGVPEENRRALREVNDQVTRLAPAILAAAPGRAVGIEAAGGVKVDALARSHGGRLYVFAVNYDEGLKETRATIKVPGLAAGAQVEVVDEGRTIPAEAGALADTFAPLAVHIYRMAEPAN